MNRDALSYRRNATEAAAVRSVSITVRFVSINFPASTILAEFVTEIET